MNGVARRSAAGFSLLELMVVVAIIGVLAAVAVPRFNIFRARARQAEAKSNLGVIFTLQEAFKIDKEEYYNGDQTHWGGQRMNRYQDADGYSRVRGAGNRSRCRSNRLGFRLANCDAARYGYWIHNGNEDQFVAMAYAASDAQAVRIFPGCQGNVTAVDYTTDVGGESACTDGGALTSPRAGGDAFCMDQVRVIFNFRDIVTDPQCND